VFRDLNIIANEPDLLPLVREVYSRRPEAYFLEPWELQSLFYLLNYTDGLVAEADIAAAVEVARTDLSRRSVSTEKRRRAAAALIRRGVAVIGISS
jgi:hypothetical protein